MNGGTDGAFGAGLHRVLGADGGNLVFSPASIAAALRMALAGARGGTATEIAAALHLSGPGAAAEGLALLAAAVTELPGEGLVFRAPNTMWVQAGYPLRPEFSALLRAAAAVSVRDADFARAADTARREINGLIAEQTEGKITDLIAPGVLGDGTLLVLVNAIYLNAAWEYPFAAEATGDAPFYRDGPGTGTPVSVRMMRLAKDLRYLRGHDYQAVLLPYRGGRLAMTIVLPDGPLSTLPPGLIAGLAGLSQHASRHRVTLALPKFRQEGQFSLVPVLQQLGIRQAFEASTADFTGISPAPPRLYVSAVVHKAFIDVDERGTEAAAATAAVMEFMSARRPTDPVTMTVDHPFLFAITDTATGLPLFLGQVSDPRSG